MARDVQVEISSAAIITALNTPGGAVRNWSEATARRIRVRAIALTPVNNPLNAIHRGGKVGEMKAGWRFNNIGTNGHRVRATIFNIADHAYWVEFGRDRSFKREVFTWQHAYVRTRTRRASNSRRLGRYKVTKQRIEMGGWVYAPNGTGGYKGKAVLLNAVNDVMPSRTNGRYTPLVYVDV
jgi:hypothetical protein